MREAYIDCTSSTQLLAETGPISEVVFVSRIILVVSPVRVLFPPGM